MVQVWMRPIVPEGSYAIAVVYIKSDGYPLDVSMSLASLNMTSSHGYNVTEVFDGKPLGTHLPNQNLTLVVNPSGIQLVKAIVLHKLRHERPPIGGIWRNARPTPLIL